MSKIYTKRGDGGLTSLGDNTKVSKSDERVHALGSIDELNSIIGLICVYCKWDKNIDLYKSIQHDLFLIGAVVSGCYRKTEPERIAYLEEKIDTVSAGLPALANFIIPGGSVVSSWLHLARNVCRRAERHIVSVKVDDPNILIYMNRLSDLFFVLARESNKDDKDVLWNKDCPFFGR